MYDVDGFVPGKRTRLSTEALVEDMSHQVFILSVKGEAPADKLALLNANLEKSKFYGEVVLKYEAGVVQRALVTESIKF